MDSKQTSTSVASIIAILAAIFSFYAGAFFGLVLALIAFLFGIFGIVSALMPNVSGGLLSILAIILSFFGVIAAIIKAIMWLL
jgi:hypothetical protein